MNRMLTMLTAAALTATGCGAHQSTYRRAQPAAGELVWTYHDRLQITLDGKVVADQDDWAPLAATVACVPRARDWAAQADQHRRTGRNLKWAGLGSVLAGIVVAGVLIGSDTDDDTRVLGGLGAAVAGTLGGAILLTNGEVQNARGDARAMDAVNLYNDEHGGCTPRPQRSPEAKAATPEESAAASKRFAE